MRKLCITLALMLMTSSLGFAQSEQGTLEKDEAKAIALKGKVKSPRFSFVSTGLGGSALFGNNAYGISAQIIDLNISTKGMKNYGVRMLGAINTFSGHDYDPDRHRRRHSSDWGMCYGISYKHRFFAKHLFNLTLGLDAVGDLSGVFLNPSISFAICW